MILLLSAPLLAGTPEPYWSPSKLPDGTLVGTTGLAAGDLDADGMLDLALSVQLPNGNIGLILELSNSDDPFYPLEFENIPLLLSMVDMDGDGVSELLMRLPESDNNNGGLSILDPLPIKPGEDFTGTVLLDIDHDTSGAYFGAAFATADLDADGTDEVLIGAPGSTVSILYAYDYVAEAEVEYTDYAAAWRGEDGGVGAAILVRPEDDEILVAVCTHDFTTTTCSDGGGLIRLAMSSWQDGSQELMKETITPVSSEVPLTLLAFPGTDTIIWAGATEKTLTNLSARSAPAALTAQGTGVAVTTTPDGEGILWVQDGDTVYAIRSPEAGTAADQAEESFRVDGLTLGSVLTPVDDLTKDGCEDVLASTADGATLYLLPGLCDAITDTGEPDTGIGPDDSGEPDSGEPDSGGTDTGAPCEDALGWTCGGQGSALLLLTGLLALRRRSGSRR